MCPGGDPVTTALFHMHLEILTLFTTAVLLAIMATLLLPHLLTLASVQVRLHTRVCVLFFLMCLAGVFVPATLFSLAQDWLRSWH